MPPVRPWHAKKIARGVRPLEGMYPGANRSRLANRPVHEPSSLNPVSVGADLLAIIVGLLGCFTVRLVGQLAASEVLILGLLPVLLAVRLRKINRSKLRLIYILMGLWLANQVLTDIYRGTAAVDWMRGDAAIVFFAIDLTFLAVLLGQNERRKLLFITSYAVGSLLAARYQPIDLMEGDTWKFGYGAGCNLLVLIIAGYLYNRRSYLFAGMLLSGIAAVNLLKNFRSPVLCLLVATALTMPFVPERIGRLRLLPRKGTMARVAFLAVMAIGAGVMAQGLVHFVTRGGFVNDEAKAKNMQQSGSGVSLLIAGRPEILVSSRAVMEHPILGFGSWAKDFKYVEMLSDIQTQFGIANDLTDLEQNSQGLIPAHSHIMGGWISAGILGAVFWVYTLSLSTRGLILVSNLRPPFALLYANMLSNFLFDILFSPFGSGRRVVDAFVIIIVVDLLESAAPAARAASRQLFQRRFARQPRVGRFA